MYDWPETRQALDNLWCNIAKSLNAMGLETPPALSRDLSTMKIWTDPDLVIGQTCGWPYVSKLRGKTIPFARFHYDLEDCSPGHYQSYYIAQNSSASGLLASKEALLGADKIAMNGDDSQSGFHVFREITGEFSPGAIPEEKRLVTGAHRDSIKAVANNEAELAAIDAVAFKLAERYDPSTVEHVEVIGKSKPKPGLPLITSPANAEMAPQLFKAVQNGVQSLSTSDRDTLMILGTIPATDSDYDEFL